MCSSATRVPIARLPCPAASAQYILGSIVSSCWRSPSITATRSALEDIQPSMTAPARPERLTRLKHRMRGSADASANAISEVPSGKSSSTTIISHGKPSRTALTRSNSTGTLADSRYVGTTTESVGCDVGRGPSGATMLVSFDVNSCLMGGDRIGDGKHPRQAFHRSERKLNLTIPVSGQRPGLRRSD